MLVEVRESADFSLRWMVGKGKTPNLTWLYSDIITVCKYIYMEENTSIYIYMEENTSVFLYISVLFNWK